MIPHPHTPTLFPYTTLFRSIFLMSRKIILIKQELLLLVYELNRSGLLAENEKIRPILAQLEKLLLCDLSPAVHFRSEERFSRNAETDLVCRLLLEKKKYSKIDPSAARSPAGRTSPPWHTASVSDRPLSAPAVEQHHRQVNASCFRFMRLRPLSAVH